MDHVTDLTCGFIIRLLSVKKFFEDKFKRENASFGLRSYGNTKMGRNDEDVGLYGRGPKSAPGRNSSE